ncbi:MAG: hypothetical protein MN733_18790 [Nitrososphaera sp.]|nr:hypothetical protein [Nitrososphaera sp.]
MPLGIGYFFTRDGAFLYKNFPLAASLVRFAFTFFAAVRALLRLTEATLIEFFTVRSIFDIWVIGSRVTADKPLLTT